MQKTFIVAKLRLIKERSCSKIRFCYKQKMLPNDQCFLKFFCKWNTFKLQNKFVTRFNLISINIFFYTFACKILKNNKANIFYYAVAFKIILLLAKLRCSSKTPII